MNCPVPKCAEKFDTLMALNNHMAEEHNAQVDSIKLVPPGDIASPLDKYWFGGLGAFLALQWVHQIRQGWQAILLIFIGFLIYDIIELARKKP